MPKVRSFVHGYVSPARCVVIACASAVTAVTGVSVASAQSAAPPARPASTPSVPSDSANARPLSLDEAVALAEQYSPVIRLARNAIVRARGGQYQARSALFPQLSGTASYTRTLRSQFQGAFTSSSGTDTAHATPAPTPPCTQYLLDPAAPTDARVLGLEAYARCAAANSGFSGIDFSRVGFGSPNAYVFGLSASQSLFTGGQTAGAIQAANAAHRAADIELRAQRAQLTLDVTQAYSDAALSDRLLAITQATLAQDEALLQQTQLQQRVGNASEFDLLRATVARNNQRPVVIQQESQRDVAYLRLKQLLGVSLEQPLRLTTSVEDTATTLAGVSLARANTPDTLTDRRAPVREAAENVTAQRGALRVTRAERIPSVSLSSSYQRLAYPNGFPGWNAFLPNWTVTLATSFPLLTGGRLRGDALVAEANLRDAQSRLVQARQDAALDARVARNTLRQAEATLAASRGTADVAQRAYQIAQVRYREGLSTQLELNDAQTQLSQALVNQAQAMRDVLVARVRLALLPDLPVQTQPVGQTTLSGQQGTSSSATTPSTQQQTAQPSMSSPVPNQTVTPAGRLPAAGTPSGGTF